MITSKEAIAKYGDPTIDNLKWERKNMTVRQLNSSIHLSNPVIPAAIYVNKDFANDVDLWLTELHTQGLLHEIKTWDGCFNIRKKRGINALSMHAFGLAVDINAAHNPLGLTREQAIAKGLRPFSQRFIEVSREFMECGWDWIKRPDGMHYQKKSLA
jgi:hypothetical protein